MKMSKIKITAGSLIVIYLLFFAARFIYAYSTYDDNFNIYSPATGNFSDSSSSALRSPANYATLAKKYDTGSGVVTMEQKYEQIATVNSKTLSYDNDLAKLDAAIGDAQAVVQTEYAQGLEGNRRLSRAIGVRPEYFQSCLEKIKEIGTVVSINIQKTDKTYVYNQMTAQKEELQKRFDNYKSLRDYGGSMTELLALEDKIIDTEGQLQKQMVDLGAYGDENAFCTINVTMTEGNPIPVLSVMWDSLGWAAGVYFVLLICAAVVFIAAFVFVKIYLYIKKAKSPNAGS